MKKSPSKKGIILYINKNEAEVAAFRKSASRRIFSYNFVTASNKNDFNKLNSINNFTAVIYNVGSGKAFFDHIIRKADYAPIILLIGKDYDKVLHRTMFLHSATYLVKDDNGIYLEILPEVIKRALSIKGIGDDLRNIRNNVEQLVKNRTLDLRIEMAERILAEQALVESERRFRDILENSRDIAYKWNINTGKYDYMSPSVKDLTGYTMDDLNRGGLTHLLTLFHQEDRKKIKNIYRKLMRRDVDDYFPNEIEYRWLCSNGEYRWFRDNRMIIRDEGLTFSIIGNIRDITIQKKADEALRESEEIAKALLNNPSDSVFLVDREGTILDLNHSSIELLSSGREELVKRNISELMSANLVQERRKIFRYIIKTKEPYRNEEENRGRWFEQGLYPIINPEGEVGKIAIFMRDITSRKQAELERAEALRILDQVFNSSPIGMCIIDNDFRFLRVNRSFLSMFAVDIDIIGMRCDIVLSEEFCYRYKDEVRRLTCDEPSIEYENIFRLPHGEIVFHISTVPYISKDGVMIGTINNIMDVTEERNLQKVLIQVIQDERQRIGEDLHDGLGQNLTAVAFLIELLRQKTVEKSYPEIEELLKAESLVKLSIQQAKSISRMLYPVEMERNGLSAAIDTLIHSVEKLFEVKCTLFQDKNFLIDDYNAANQLFYIAREAIDLFIKHCLAKNISIRLLTRNKGFDMILRHDGQSHNSIQSAGIDMMYKIMQYRAKMIGAKLLFSDAAPDGFELIIHLNKPGR